MYFIEHPIVGDGAVQNKFRARLDETGILLFHRKILNLEPLIPKRHCLIYRHFSKVAEKLPSAACDALSLDLPGHRGLKGP
jgi:hypothetical protein